MVVFDGDLGLVLLVVVVADENLGLVLLEELIMRGKRWVVSHGWRVVGGRPWGVKRMESVGVVVVRVSSLSVVDCDCCCCTSGKIVPGGR